MRYIPLTKKHYFENPNGGYVRKYVLNLVFKFYNDPTANESGIIVLLKQTWVYEKKRGFWDRKKEKKEIGIKRKLRDVSSL